MKVYLVIGDPDMGKSSVVRHLVAFTKGTGRSLLTKKLRVIHGHATIDMYISFYGYQALQESGILPQDFIRIVKKQPKQPSDLILALRLKATKANKKHKDCPDADDYIQAFIKAGWTISKSVVLDDSGKAKYPNHWKALSVLSRPAQGKPTPTNQLAADTRKYFGWM
jgi:hypothetical protein